MAAGHIGLDRDAVAVSLGQAVQRRRGVLALGGGDRQLNAALHLAAVTQVRSPYSGHCDGRVNRRACPCAPVAPSASVDRRSSGCCRSTFPDRAPASPVQARQHARATMLQALAGPKCEPKSAVLSPDPVRPSSTPVISRARRTIGCKLTNWKPMPRSVAAAYALPSAAMPEESQNVTSAKSTTSFVTSLRVTTADMVASSSPTVSMSISPTTDSRPTPPASTCVLMFTSPSRPSCYRPRRKRSPHR